MPIIWDRQCRFWKGDGQRLMTTIGGANHVRCVQREDKQHTPRVQMDDETPPPRKKSPLDNGQGKTSPPCVIICPATMPRTPAYGCRPADGPTPPPETPSHRIFDAGHTKCHHTPSAGCTQDPMPCLDECDNTRASKVIQLPLPRLSRTSHDRNPLTKPTSFPSLLTYRCRGSLHLSSNQGSLSREPSQIPCEKRIRNATYSANWDNPWVLGTSAPIKGIASYWLPFHETPSNTETTCARPAWPSITQRLRF
jgi:hypothetical protein